MAKKTLIIDFDSTLVTLESLDELARIALADHPNSADVFAEIEQITELGMLGKISFDESLQRRLQLFSAHKSHVDQVVKLLKCNISPSAAANIARFQKHANNIYIISGGFEEYILPVVEELGLEVGNVYANSFIFDKSGNITGYDTTRLLCAPQGKVKQVKDLGLGDSHVVMIGDGYTDFEVKEYGAANEFWAFAETVNRPDVEIRADKVVRDFAEVFAD